MAYLIKQFGEIAKNRCESTIKNPFTLCTYGSLISEVKTAVGQNPVPLGYHHYN